MPARNSNLAVVVVYGYWYCVSCAVGTRKRIISPNPRTPKAAMHHEHAVKQFSQDTTTEETRLVLMSSCHNELLNLD